jgi:hypothetical protein
MAETSERETAAQAARLLATRMERGGVGKVDPVWLDHFMHHHWFGLLAAGAQIAKRMDEDACAMAAGLISERAEWEGVDLDRQKLGEFLRSNWQAVLLLSERIVPGGTCQPAVQEEAGAEQISA